MTGPTTPDEGGRVNSRRRKPNRASFTSAGPNTYAHCDANVSFRSSKLLLALRGLSPPEVLNFEVVKIAVAHVRRIRGIELVVQPAKVCLKPPCKRRAAKILCGQGQGGGISGRYRNRSRHIQRF